MKKLENIRTNYKLGNLNQSSLAIDPISQFKAWFSEVVDKITEPNAMILSTCEQKESVSARVVLLKEIKKDGFVFYTHYNSLKGQQIEFNNNVALSFFWPKHQR